jgi:hypothetical protein
MSWVLYARARARSVPSTTHTTQQRLSGQLVIISEFRKTLQAARPTCGQNLCISLMCAAGCITQIAFGGRLASRTLADCCAAFVARKSPRLSNLGECSK